MSTMNASVEIRSFFQKVLENYRLRAEQQGVLLTLEVDEDVPQSLTTDQLKMDQALNALMEQAFVRTCQGSVTVRVQNEDGHVAISVEDSGVVLDPGKIRAILDPKASSSTWGQDEQLAEIAMPLRLSANFIRLLGGQLEMTSSEKGRTCFSFALSDAMSQAAPKPSPAEKEPTKKETNVDRNSQGTIRVLLVDDVQENRALLEVLLKKMGYLCKHGTNGQEAVEICRQERFDLILMDLQMPLMDGLAAIQQIRSHSLNQKTPILAMTASGQRGDDLKALEAGCNDCLSKPVNGQRLQRKVWRLLAQEKQIQAAESGEEILSFLEGDPDYQKAVETFVENLPAKIEEMRKAFEKKDLKDLAFKAHALKGLGGFAGFPVFTEKAKSLEETVKAADLERIGQQLDEMVQLCMRTRLQNK